MSVHLRVVGCSIYNTLVATDRTKFYISQPENRVSVSHAKPLLGDDDSFTHCQWKYDWAALIANQAVVRKQ